MTNYNYTSGNDTIAVITKNTVKLDACGQVTQKRFHELERILHSFCFPCAITSVKGHWILHTDLGQFLFNYEFTLERGIHY